LAKHILKSKGPSGENKEYLFQLEKALESLDNNDQKGGRDEHVRELVREVKRLEGEQEEEEKETNGGGGGGVVVVSKDIEDKEKKKRIVTEPLKEKEEIEEVEK